MSEKYQKGASLGELGKALARNVLRDEQYDKIRILNEENYSNLYCEKNGRGILIRVISRWKYKENGEINKDYNLSSNYYSEIHEIANIESKKYNAEPYWMAIQFDMNDYSVYFGSLECLDGKNSIPVNKCERGEVGTILVNKKKHHFDFASHKNKK